MTARGLYEAVLIELHKENAPNLILEDFNYFANKAINQYINKRYNIYDVNQQTTDDLRVLKATAILTPTDGISDYDGLTTYTGRMAVAEVILPSDYLHLLNCICIYELQKTYKCYNKGDTWRAAARRLTADAYSQVLDNFWNKPDYKRPYYYIHNVNKYSTNPTNPYVGETTTVTYYDINDIPSPSETLVSDTFSDAPIYEIITYEAEDDFYTTGRYKKITRREKEINRIRTSVADSYSEETKLLPPDKRKTKTVSKGGTDFSTITKNGELETSGELGKDGNNSTIIRVEKGLPKTITLRSENGTDKFSNVERAGEVRYGNVSEVRLEIRYGTDNSVFKLKQVYIDYIKAPLHIRLTQLQVDRTEDTSQMLEYPDYVCQEIANELVHIIMENISDLRLQTHPVVSLSIANPAQALAPDTAGKS